MSDGVIDVSDYTTGDALATTPGMLVLLDVEGTLSRSDGPGAFVQSLLHIDEALSSCNRGDIRHSTVDGNVFVTDACLEPLVASDEYTLRQNRPNPFNPVTVIEYVLPVAGRIRLHVFDRHGRDVALLDEGERDAGTHQIVFDASDLPSGMYFYRLDGAHGVLTRKMVLLR